MINIKGNFPHYFILFALSILKSRPFTLRLKLAIIRIEMKNEKVTIDVERDLSSDLYASLFQSIPG